MRFDRAIPHLLLIVPWRLCTSLLCSELGFTIQSMRYDYEEGFARVFLGFSLTQCL